MKYLLVYFPFIIAWSLLGDPVLSYWISWSSSVMLIVLVIAGVLRPTNYTSSWLDHPLRPLFIPHLVFAGYMSLSSIFYFWSLYGYVFLEKIEIVAPDKSFELAAIAQCLYYLGHAGLLHGILLSSNYSRQETRVKAKSITVFSLQLAVAFTLVNIGLSFFPQLGQIIDRISRLSMVAATIALALAIPERKASGLILALLFFGINFLQALLSGWKESILTPVILLGAFLLPVYRVKIALLMVPILIAFIFILPTFNGAIRANTWEGGVDQREALKIAIDAVQGQKDFQATNWDFLVVRFSEIALFVKYIDNVPAVRPFYGTQIIEQGIESLIPRVILPNKGITEEIVMRRVWENGVAESISTVSAKPQIVVDGYLSFGYLGAWFFCFLVGWSGGSISVLAERLFGGYFLGTGVIFSGLFSVYLRGNCFEFMLNPIVWSMALMFFLYFVFLFIGVIEKQNAPFGKS